MVHTHKFGRPELHTEDLDVILKGEIRDQETLNTALEASQTGHLVFGTLHTNSAVKTVERVLEKPRSVTAFGILRISLVDVERSVPMASAPPSTTS